jgi:hypothetical protein
VGWRRTGKSCGYDWWNTTSERVTKAYNSQNKYERWNGTIHCYKSWSNFLSSTENLRVAKVRWANGLCLGRWIQCCLICIHFGRWSVENSWFLKMYGHNSYVYTIPCSVFSTLHAILSSMRIRTCLECYVRYVHN